MTSQVGIAEYLLSYKIFIHTPPFDEHYSIQTLSDHLNIYGMRW